jgi:hypothetical protein
MNLGTVLGVNFRNPRSLANFRKFTPRTVPKFTPLEVQGWCILRRPKFVLPGLGGERVSRWLRVRGSTLWESDRLTSAFEEIESWDR